MPETETATVGTGRRVMGNTVWLSFGQAIVMANMTLWTILVARYIGPSTYGTYTYAQSATSVLLILPSLGLDYFLIRDVARRPELGWQRLAPAFLLRLTLCMVFLGGFLLWNLTRATSASWYLLLVIVTANGFISSLGALAVALLMARENMARVVLAQVVNAGLTLSTGAVAVWLKQPFNVILGLSLGATCMQVALTYYFMYRLFGTPRWADITPHLSIRALAELILKVMPFTATIVLATAQSNLMVLIMRGAHQDSAVLGYYGVANRIYMMLMIVPDRLSAALLPAFSRVYAESQERFVSMFERGYRYIFILTTPLAAGMWVLAPQILNLLFGSGYQPAAGALRVLALGLLNSPSFVMGPAMTALNKQSVLAWTWAVIVLIMGGFGLWAVPLYGALGASYGMLASNMVGLVLYSALLFRWLPVRYPVAWVSKTLLASLGMAWAAAWLVQQIHFLLVAGVAAPIIYVVLLMVSRTFSAGDRRQLAALLLALIPRSLIGLATALRKQMTRIKEVLMDGKS